MVKKLDPDQIEAYLREHLPYEFLMLRYTAQKLEHTRNQLDWNAYYESFVVHARNLYGFLTNDEDVAAGAFVQHYRKRLPAFPTKKIVEQVLHLGPSRPAEVTSKLTISDVKKCLEWLEEGFADFLSQLPNNLRPMWDVRKSMVIQRGKGDASTSSTLVVGTGGAATYQRDLYSGSSVIRCTFGYQQSNRCSLRTPAGI